MMANQAISKMIVVQALIERNNQLLMVANRWPDGLHWGLPGGKLEYGESIPDALAREVREETGLEVNLDYIAYIHEKRWRDTYGMFITCGVSEVGGELKQPDGEEIVELKFVSTDGAPSLIALADIRKPLETWLRNRSLRSLHFTSDGTNVTVTGREND